MALDTGPEAETEAETEAFVGRLFEAGLGTMDLLCVYLGDRLGLYSLLASSLPMTAGEVATRAGVDARHVREWLEQQAATGVLDVDHPGEAAEARRYSLPAARAEALIDLDSPYSMAPMARSIVACAAALPSILDAFRSGAGVPWSSYGDEMIQAQGDFNRPWLTQSFGAEHLPSIPDVHARLSSDPPARVADVACGVGWASIAIARAYPKASVHGFDLDEASIELARRNADEAGLAGRVTFEARDAADPALGGLFDLAVMIEALHDLSQPVEVLAAMRGMLAPGGTVLIADEKTEETFAAPADEAERLFYAYSVLCCLPAAMVDRPTAATGTVMRPATVRSYAEQAGFSDVDILPNDLGFLRLYRLTP